MFQTYHTFTLEEADFPRLHVFPITQWVALAQLLLSLPATRFSPSRDVRQKGRPNLKQDRAPVARQYQEAKVKKKKTNSFNGTVAVTGGSSLKGGRGCCHEPCTLAVTTSILQWREKNSLTRVYFQWYNAPFACSSKFFSLP